MSDGRRYSRQEAEEIFRRALAQQSDDGEGFSSDELMAAARDLGIDPTKLGQVAEEVERERAALEVRRAEEEADAEAARSIRRGRLKGLVGHVVPFTLINGVLVAIDAWISAGLFWSLFLLLPWSLGLAAHALAALWPISEKQIAKRRKQLEKQRQKEAAREAKREARKRGAGAPFAADFAVNAERRFEYALERGVAMLIDAAASKIEDAADQYQRRQRPDHPRVRVVDVDSDRPRAEEDEEEEEDRGRKRRRRG